MRNPRNALIAARTSSAALLASLIGCAAPGANDSPATELGSTSQAASTLYDTGFTANLPDTTLPPRVIVLTFDDGPDWPLGETDPISEADTMKVLDILKKENVRATFFINGRNEADLLTDDGKGPGLEQDMADMVRRMVVEHHELASHTWHHFSVGMQADHPYWDAPNTPPWDFIPGDLTEEQIDEELTKLEDTVDLIFGEGKVRLSMFRAPYGEPFQTNGRNLDLASSVVAKHAVHVGWNFDTKDYACGSPGCSVANLKQQIPPGSGNSGILLMHSTQPVQSADLEETIKYLKDEGYEFWTTEQYICHKWGKYSAELVDGSESTKCDKNNPQPAPEPDIGDVPPGDGDTGDGDTGDGDTGDGDTGDGDSGDGDSSDGDSGDGDSGDGDGDSGDGDGDSGDGDGDSGDGDGSDDGTNDDGCSVGVSGDAGLAGLWALGLGATFLVRRRRQR